jgi:predicted Zn-dependent protease
VVLEAGGRGEDLEKVATEYIERSKSKGLKVHHSEPVKIAGKPALRALGTASTSRGSLHMVITWVGFRGTIYRISGMSLSRRHEGIFVNTARSLRPLSPELLDSITETRLRIVRAEAGETLVQLSQRTRNEWNVHLTAVMNGLFSKEKLEAGQQVKIAVAEKYKPRAGGG